MIIIDIWYKLINILPFNWVHYDFMKNALLATLLITPLFAVLGTMVINNRMVFFTDVLGHSALTGIAVGVLLGIMEPTLPMIGLAIILAVGITLLKNVTKTPMDTVLGVVFAFIVALGIVILSRQGGFVKYTSYLIGDILSVSIAQIFWLLIIFIVIIIYWVVVGNNLISTSINISLAKSRGINTFLVETSFAVLLAVVVMISIRLVGILIINSLLIIPAAASRNISKSIAAYTGWSIVISVISGIVGLIFSYYWGTASGATIVLFTAGFYLVSTVIGRMNK